MTKLVERKSLSRWEKWYLPQILHGLTITFVHFFKRKVTIQYPEERPVIPDGYRGVPTLIKDSEGREKCVACQLCEFSCPSKAIRVVPGPISTDSPFQKVEKAPKEFEINMLRCIYCGVCESACPEQAIVLQKRYSLTSYSRKELIFNKDKLYAMGGTLPDKYNKWKNK
ncbi:MAG: NADH dehydrogenase [Verrucomicrobia bacterium GWC2_42_7]|nr:MAG: NADH dehydrogenase [Verrucomicrobia bacterium GWC2_42_7]